MKIILVFAAMTFGLGALAKCPPPKKIAEHVINYWIDGVPYQFGQKKCFKKSRYQSITAKKVAPDIPYSTKGIVLVDDQKPYKIVSVKEDHSVDYLMRYKADVIFYSAKDRKPIPTSFTFDLNDNGKSDRKVYGCAFHSGLDRKYLRKSCLKKKSK